MSLLNSYIRMLLEKALGLHGAGMSEKDLASRLGYGGIELNKNGAVTDEEADAIAKIIAKEKPERVFAYSRGAAALSKAALDDDMPGLPPVTYVAPAALRGWTDAPVPGVPGGSITIIGDKDDKVPVKQACKIAQQAGTPLYVYPGKSHVSILYTHGEVGGDAYEIDIDKCVVDEELPDWGKGNAGSKEEIEKQQKLAPTYKLGTKNEGKEAMKIKLSQLRKIIREEVEKAVEHGMAEAEKEEDLNKDGKNDFEDVMIARMKASGMKHDKAVKKGEKAAEKAASQKQSVQSKKY